MGKLIRKTFSKIPMAAKMTVALPTIGGIGGGIIGGTLGARKTKGKLVAERRQAWENSQGHREALEATNADQRAKDFLKYREYRDREALLDAERLDVNKYRRSNILRGIKKGALDGSSYGFLAALPFVYKTLK